MLVGDTGLTGRDEPVLGGDLAGERLEDPDRRPCHGDQHGRADEPAGHRVAGRAEPDARQLVDLPAGRPGAQLGPQRRQRPQQCPFGLQPHGRDRADLRVDDGVDLGAPRRGRGVRPGQVRDIGFSGHDQVALGIAHQVLHDAFGFRIGCLAEVGPEPVVRGEPHVLRRRHHHIRDHPCLQAAHPVGQHGLGHPAQGLETLRDQRHGRGALLIGGEPHEQEP
jgi:hypothetical protein